MSSASLSQHESSADKPFGASGHTHSHRSPPESSQAGTCNTTATSVAVTKPSDAGRHQHGSSDACASCTDSWIEVASAHHHNTHHHELAVDARTVYNHSGSETAFRQSASNNQRGHGASSQRDHGVARSFQQADCSAGSGNGSPGISDTYLSLTTGDRASWNDPHTIALLALALREHVGRGQWCSTPSNAVSSVQSNAVARAAGSSITPVVPCMLCDMHSSSACHQHANTTPPSPPLSRPSQYDSLRSVLAIQQAPPPAETATPSSGGRPCTRFHRSNSEVLVEAEERCPASRRDPVKTVTFVPQDLHVLGGTAHMGAHGAHVQAHMSRRGADVLPSEAHTCIVAVPSTPPCFRCGCSTTCSTGAQDAGVELLTSQLAAVQRMGQHLPRSAHSAWIRNLPCELHAGHLDSPDPQACKLFLQGGFPVPVPAAACSAQRAAHRDHSASWAERQRPASRPQGYKRCMAAAARAVWVLLFARCAACTACMYRACTFGREPRCTGLPRGDIVLASAATGGRSPLTRTADMMDSPA
eukprot:jgi/Ulvmu1/8860/UM049_0042.1